MNKKILLPIKKSYLKKSSVINKKNPMLLIEKNP